MNFSPEISQNTHEGILDMQGTFLRETIQYVYKNSDYYRAALNKAGVRPKDIKGIPDIRKLPITSKEDIQKDNWAFLCVPKRKIAEVVSTTGTTGHPIFNAMTESDLERLAENERRFFSLLGVTNKDLFQITVTLDNLFVAGIAYYRGLMKLGVGVIRIGPNNPKRQLEIMKKLRPTGIIAVPSFMLSIYKEAEEEGIKPENITFKKAILIGESIRNKDFSSNTLGEMLNRKNSGVKYYSTYGITEAAIAFCECSSLCGFHSHSDFVFAEILDNEGNQVKEGEIGELTLTTFKVEGMPLVRYRTGDMTFKTTKKCNCGRLFPRIGPILGRKAHKLKIKGTTIYPKAIENALLGVEGVENYVIEAHSKDDLSDHMIVTVGSQDRSEPFKQLLCENIKAKARVTTQVEIVSPSEVNKILYQDGRRKPRIFIDRR